MQQPQAREESVNEHTIVKIQPEEVMVSTKAAVHDQGQNLAIGNDAVVGMQCHDCLVLGNAVVVREIGTVTAGHVCQKGYWLDLLEAYSGLKGGENSAYSDLVNEATQEALKKLRVVASVSFLLCVAAVRSGVVGLSSHCFLFRLWVLAQEAGANVVVKARFHTATTMNRFIFGLHASVLASGTVRFAFVLAIVLFLLQNLSQHAFGCCINIPGGSVQASDACGA